jgi:hypothetical protein
VAKHREEVVLAAIGFAQRRFRDFDVRDIDRAADVAQKGAVRSEARRTDRAEPAEFADRT